MHTLSYRRARPALALPALFVAALVAVLVFGTPNAHAQTIIYVDAGVTIPGDGSSWDAAYSDLQDALVPATAGTEIWVAAGIYKPTAGNDRAVSFQLKSGVAVYGGFAGTEALRTGRDWVANPTVLSGDIGMPDDNSDNSYHVVVGSGTDGTAVLDGVAVTSGNASGFPSDLLGGGMLNVSGSPTLTNVTFSGNRATTGGGMYSTDGSPTLTNVTFNGNSAGSSGGGMFNTNNSPTLTNVTFNGNSAGHSGGGMTNSNGSSPTLTNVTFSGNSARSGGGMFNFDASSPALTNSIVWGNSAPDGPGIYNDFFSAPSNPSISYSIVQGSGGSGAWDPSVGADGGNNLDADPLFVDAPGGDLRLSMGSPAIDAGNNAPFQAGGVASGVTTDLDGNDRIIGEAIDLGPYEYEPANQPPVITAVYVPTDPVAVGAAAAVSAPFTDPDAGAAPTCSIDYDDGTTAPGAVTGNATEGYVCTGTHVYTAAGVYTVAVTVTDAAGASDMETATGYLVVYDPSAGFVTGGGWIDSPAGAYPADPTLTGRATFGFVSKYKKGQSVPDGNTQFEFRAGGLSFRSTAYEWLVIAGPNAKFKGRGTVGGAGDFGFMLTATDGEVSGGGGADLFRIKIWDRANGDAVVYDNRMGEGDDGYAGTALGGGQIRIHRTGGNSATGGTSASRSSDDAAPLVFALSGAYPNPSSDAATVAFAVPEAAHVRLVVYDVLGREVAVLADGPFEVGRHAAVLDGRSLPAGTYLVRMTSGGPGGFARTERLTLVR